VPEDLSLLIRAQTTLLSRLADDASLPVDAMRHATAELQATLAEAARLRRLAAPVRGEAEAEADAALPA